MRSHGHTWARPSAGAVLVAATLGAVVALQPGGAPVEPAGAQSSSEDYPGGQYPDPPRMGQWDHVQIGIAQPRPEDMTFTKKYYGMRHAAIWLDSQLFTASGKYYLTSNAVQSDSEGNLESSSWLPASLQSSPAGLVPDPRVAPWSCSSTAVAPNPCPTVTPPTVELTPDNKLKYTVANLVTTEEIVFDDKTFEWKSADGSIDMKGTVVAPPTTWLLPWREPNGHTDKLLYTTHHYQIAGTYYGEKLTGYMTLEQMWANQYYSDTWAVSTRTGNLGWFANEYDDGTRESGFWLCAEYGQRGVAFANNKGETVLSTREINITQKPNNLYEFALGDGSKWEFAIDPTASLAPLIGTGLFKRANEKRKIVHHQALFINVGNDPADPCRPAAAMIRRRRRFLAAGLLVVVLLAAYTTTRAQDSGYRYPSPPLIGAWEQVLIGTFQPFPEDQLVTKTYWGLHHTETWLDFYLRNDSGKYYLTSNALQSSADGSQLTANPWLERGLQSSANGMVVDPRTKQWTGTASQELTAEAKVKYTATNGARAETISFDDKTAEWKSENGDIDLKGTLVSPGINWLLPYREQSGETDEIYYAAQSYKVDGTYHGEPVKGYVQIEHFFGTTTYRDSWWWRNRLGNWVYWNNEYADGSQEYGQFLCGEYGARGAAVANDKGEQVLNTREINATAGQGGNINYEIAKHGRFEYIDDPTGRLPKTSATGSYGTGLVQTGRRAARDRAPQRRQLGRRAALRTAA